MGRRSVQRVGITILRVLAVRAIELIPIYGPIVSIGAEIGDRLLGEVETAGTAGRRSREEVLRGLQELTLAETTQTVDEVLASDEGRRLTVGLTADQLLNVRRQLIGLPSDMEQLLLRLEADERREAAERMATLERERAERRQRDAERLAELRATLKAQLERTSYPAAYETTRTMLGIAPRDAETLRVQRWLEKRSGKRLRAEVLLGAVGGGFLAFGVALVEDGRREGSITFDPSSGRAFQENLSSMAYVEIVAVGVILFAIGALVVGAFRRARRRVRIRRS